MNPTGVFLDHELDNQPADSARSSPEYWETAEKSNEDNQRDTQNHNCDGLDDSHDERVETGRA